MGLLNFSINRASAVQAYCCWPQWIPVDNTTGDPGLPIARAGGN
jgi:hypothetical protein